MTEEEQYNEDCGLMLEAARQFMKHYPCAILAFTDYVENLRRAHQTKETDKVVVTGDFLQMIPDLVCNRDTYGFCLIVACAAKHKRPSYIQFEWVMEQLNKAKN